MEKGKENRDSVEEPFAILAFLEAFLESKDEVNDFDTASEVLWSVKRRTAKATKRTIFKPPRSKKLVFLQ